MTIKLLSGILLLKKEVLDSSWYDLGGLLMKNLKEYIYLKDLVAECGGIEKFRFFGHLAQYDLITSFGFGLSY